ncbi:MAG: hypothetical protein ACOZBH_01785 [Patescibacteria group bacterium]
MIPQNHSLKIISNCPACRAMYNPAEINIVDEKENAHILHLTCQRCKNNMLVLLLASAKGISSIGLLTDLESSEAVKFIDSRPISSDEVLEAKELMSDTRKFFEILKR